VVKEDTMKICDGFGLAYYVQTLTRLLGEPGRFFSEYPRHPGFGPALCFLVVSSVIFAGARLACTAPPRPLLIGAILLLNALGMVFIASGLGYLVLRLFGGRTVNYPMFFNIYALSSGITLLASWVPFLVILSEPWKWWLIATGLTRGCGLSWKRTGLIVVGSMALIIVGFAALLPVMAAEGT
jgi:hypothetical protein